MTLAWCFFWRLWTAARLVPRSVDDACDFFSATHWSLSSTSCRNWCSRSVSSRLSLWICISCCREWYLLDRTQCKSWLVLVWHPSGRTQWSHGQCQCGTCQREHNAVMVSFSKVPVGQDTMQSWLVSVWHLLDRTQGSHGYCQCDTCQTRHNAVMASVSVVQVTQDTMQSWLVWVWYLSDRKQWSHG